jgi:hypothetical protein
MIFMQAGEILYEEIIIASLSRVMIEQFYEVPRRHYKNK